MITLALALALVAVPASPEVLIYEDTLGSITIFKSPCAEVVLSLINPAIAENFSAALYVGKATQGRLAACWWRLPDSGLVYVHFEDGDRAVLQMARFRPVRSVLVPPD